jgi:hypothetical protein
MADTKTTAQIEAERKQKEAEQHKHQEEQRKKAEADKAKAEQGGHKPQQGAGGRAVGGAMSTYGSPKPKMPDPEPVAMSFDEVKGLVGEVHRGELGHIELDEEGHPTGAAFRDIPDPDSVTAAVYGTPTVQFDELVTPSGAPITKMMNPEPKLWDAGMMARNPIPEMTDRQREFRTIGGGVINQPVTV